MRGIIKTQMAVMVFFLLSILPSGLDASVIKLAAVMPEGSTWIVAIQEMNRQIQKQTRGEVTMQLYAGGVAGDELDIIRKMRSNRIHAAAFSGVGLGQIMPHIRVLETPRLLRTDEEVDIVKARMFDEFSADFLERDMVLLGFAESGFVNMFSKRDISNIDSFRTIRMWVWKGDPLAEMFINDLGISTVPLHITDVNTGLDTGMIDSFYGPPLAATAFQWYARTKYMVNAPIVHSLGALLINKGTFEGLGTKNQEVIRRVVKEYAAELVRLTRKDNAEAVEVIRKSGVVIVEPSEELLSALDQRALITVNNSIPKLYSKDLYTRILNIVDEIRKDGP